MRSAGLAVDPASVEALEPARKSSQVLSPHRGDDVDSAGELAGSADDLARVPTTT